MNSIKEKLARLAIWLDDDVRAKGTVAMLQVVVAVSGGIWSAKNEYSEAFKIIFIVATALVLVSMCVVLLFHRRFDLNLLFCNRETGQLYDKRLRIQNVALSKSTFEQLLEQCKASGALNKLGHDIGKNFVELYRAIPGEGDKIVDPLEFLKHLLRYDSSSGFGRCEYVKHNFDGTPRWIVISIKNPITNIDSLNNDLSPFLLGYLHGLVCTVFSVSYLIDWQQSSKRGEVTVVEVKFKA